MNVSLSCRHMVDHVLLLASLNKNNFILNFYWLLTGICLLCYTTGVLSYAYSYGFNQLLKQQIFSEILKVSLNT